jgi:hypothetical protein
MTRKDYTKAVTIINNGSFKGKARANVIDMFVDLFSNDNLRFDEKRFRDACEAGK